MSENERPKVPSEEEIAAALRATAELVARRRAVPEEEQVRVTSPKITDAGWLAGRGWHGSDEVLEDE